jgi:hypothetical protein
MLAVSSTSIQVQGKRALYLESLKAAGLSSVGQTRLQCPHFCPSDATVPFSVASKNSDPSSQSQELDMILNKTEFDSFLPMFHSKVLIFASRLKKTVRRH